MINMFQNIELFKTNTYLILLMVEWTLVLLFLQYLDFTKLTKGSSETNFNNAIKVQKNGLVVKCQLHNAFYPSPVRYTLYLFKYKINLKKMNVKDKIKRIFLQPKVNIIRISGNICDDFDMTI